MSQISLSTPEEIFRASLEAYEKKTKKDISAHPLAAKLKSCDSPGDVLDLLQAQVKASDKSQSADEGLTKLLDPVVNVLCSFSTTIGGAVGLVFPPATAIFTGIGVLLQAGQGVQASQDVLVDLFGRLGKFFKRLEKYIEVRPTAAMTDIIVKIMVEVLTILGIVTKEMEQGRMEKYLKKMVGRKDFEDALMRLDRLTQEEASMAKIEALKITHNIVDEMKDVEEKVDGINETVQNLGTEVEGVGDKAQGFRDKVQEVNDKASSANEGVRETKVELQQMAIEVGILHRRRVREDLQKWISPPDPSVNYDTASGAHHEGTATWCTKKEDNFFTDWKASGSLLWIHGKPGSGKSILSSVIIRDIQAGPGFTAYFYFDFKDTRKQDSRALLSSLLFQLSNQSDQFCDVLRKLYSENQEGLQKPNISSLFRCLKSMLTVAGQGPVYLVMDALDECPENSSGVSSPREKVLELVKELVELRLPNLRLCVTSRPEFDICAVLEPLKPHQLSLHDENGQREDIGTYVTSFVHSDRKMKKWRDEDKDMVIEKLKEKADGMFRWVFCQLGVLRHCVPIDLRRILEDLPKSLDETYERILKGINKENWEYAYRLLECLTVAVRPLRVEELARVIAVDFNPGEIPELNAAWRWEDQEEAVLSACSSLVTVINDDGSRVVQFSHFSVKEFMISDRLRLASSKFHILIEPANATLAQACLCILLRLDDQANEDSKSIPLVRYAAEYWVKHAQLANEELGITDTMDYFLDMDKPHFSAWVRIQGLNDLLRFSASEQTRTAPPPAAPLYFAAEGGFRGLVGRMIDKHPTYLNTWGGVYGTPLHASVLGGHIEVAQILVTRGADVKALSADKWTPLHLASQEGHLDIGTWLLNLHVDVDPRQAKGWTPLHMAMPNGHLEVARTLLEHHAEVNAQDHDGRIPLHYASWKGYLDVVRLLLDRGADARIQDNSGYPPLHFAVTSRQLDIARMLLEHKAEADFRDRFSRRTFLHFASAQGHEDVVQFFLDHRADVDACDKDGNTPLHLAASNGNIGAARILLGHNAEVDARNYEGSTPLHKASDGEPGTVQLLLDCNADMYACDDTGDTPLRIAAATGNFEVAQILFEHVRKNLPE